MQRIFKKVQSGNTRYFFAALLPISIIAFWESYFSGFFSRPRSFSFYFHFHTIMAVSWLFLLVYQPYLFSKRKYWLHRQVGRVSYLVFPLLICSIVLLAHHRYKTNPVGYLQLFIPFKDIVIAVYGFLIAVYFRNKISLHVRGMLLTGLVFLEPVLIRLFSNYVIAYPYAMYLVMLVLYGILILLIISEKKYKTGRWVFPPVLAFYIVAHYIILTEYHCSLLQHFAEWFRSLPLT